MREPEPRPAAGAPSGGDHEGLPGDGGPPPGAFSALLEQLARPPSGSSWALALRRGGVIGRYELVREIGRGGFGVVWEARDRALGRAVAFKAVCLRTPQAVQDERRLREAEVAARLSHPNIVTLHDVGNTTHGPWLVFELLRGRTLAARLDEGPVALDLAVRIGLRVARGLAHAHAQGVVHRDLKPGNVFVCDDGQVKVLDFGLAHAFGAEKAEGGTPDYMAPEQRRGAPEDERTDVYALGVVLHLMLTQELPEAGKRRRGSPGLAVPGLPELGTLVTRMLRDDPVERPRDGREVVAALEAIRQSMGETPASAPARARPRPLRRGPRLATSVGLAVLAGIAAAAVAVSLSPGVQQKVQRRLRDWWPAALPAEQRLVVLPFRPLGGGTGDDAYAAGLIEVVTGGVRRLEPYRSSLRVVSAGDVLKENVTSAKEARSAFGATLALTGVIQWSPDRVTILTNLVDARSADVLAAREVEAPRGNGLELQRKLLAQVAEMLQLQMGSAPEAGRGGEPRAPGAYDFWLQGRGYLQRYDRAENVDSALSVFDQALARDPAYALAHAGKAEAFARRYRTTRDPGALAEARTSLARALQLGEGLAPVQLTSALVERAGGAYETAIASLRRALEIEPASLEAQRELANAFEAAGQKAEAEAAFRRVLEQRPDSWAASNDLGVFYFRGGRAAAALPLFQRVVELTPDNGLGWSNLGATLSALGRKPEALDALRRSVALRPTARAWGNLGVIHYYAGRYGDAAEAYRKSVELSPADAEWLGALADSERWAGRPEAAAGHHRQAVALLRRQLEVNARDAEGWSRLAMHEAALGERALAAADLERALRLDPADGKVQFRAALVHEELGQRERALEAAARALRAGHPREEIEMAPPLRSLVADVRYRKLGAARPGEVNPK